MTKKIEGQYFSIESIFSLNKFIWTQWYTFHDFAGKFRQNITNFRSSCENVFANDSFPGKKYAKSPSGSVENSCDNRADNFLSKIHCFKFYKRFRSIFERKYQTVNFFQKRNNLLDKDPLDGKTHFYSRLEIHRQSMTSLRPRAEKNSETFLFSKKETSPKTFIWARRGLFDYHPKKRQKN